MLFRKMLIIAVLLAAQRSLACDGVLNACTSEKTQEESLITHLFACNRNFSRIFPKMNSTDEDKVKIKLKVEIKNIEDINPSENEATLLLRFDAEWQSSLLHWNASAFGISRLAVDASSVWTPKFEVKESLNMIDIEAAHGDTVYLTNNGEHRLSLYRKVRLACADDACLFPMDKYSCNLTVVLKRINASSTILEAGGIKERTLLKFGTWNVKSFEPKGSQLVFPDSGDWPVLRSLLFEINVERQHEFYMISLLFPMALLGLLSISSVFLPANTGDRIAMLLSCLLSIMITLETVFKHVPNNSKNYPIVVIMNMIILLSTVLQIIIAAICLNWANKTIRKKKPSKKFVFILFYVLGALSLIISWVWRKIKSHAASRRKMKVDDAGKNDVIEDDPSLVAIKPDQEADNSEKKGEEVEEKSYGSAIKILDIFAMILALASLAVLIMGFGILYFGNDSPAKNIACQFFQKNIIQYFTFSK